MVLPTNPESAGYKEFLRRGGDPNSVNMDSTTGSSAVPTVDSYYGGYTQGYYAEDRQPLQQVAPTQSSRSVSYRQPTGQTTTQRTVMPGPAPTIPELDEFSGPDEWSGERRSAEIQKQSALSLREARRSLREVVLGLNSDPASKLARSRALEAHGINVERAIGGGRQYAKAVEDTDLAREMQTSLVNYQAYLSNRATLIQQAWNEWLSKGETISKTKHTYGSDDTTTGNGGYSTSSPWHWR